MTDKPLLTWDEYYDKCMSEDPHGISAEAREVDPALRSYWDSFWRWSDGTPVAGCFYYNYGAAIKMARKYGFMLPQTHVDNHARLKAVPEDGHAWGHSYSFRCQAPRDTAPTIMGK